MEIKAKIITTEIRNVEVEITDVLNTLIQYVYNKNGISTYDDLRGTDWYVYVGDNYHNGDPEYDYHRESTEKEREIVNIFNKVTGLVYE